jgi:hypothetical protein
MIGPDDIEAFADDFDTLDRVLERVQKGVPQGREIMANETRAVLNAAYIMRDYMRHVAVFMQDQKAREMQGMDVGNDTD